MIAGLRNLLIGLAIGLLIGVGVGYYTEGQFAKADQLDAATTARHQTTNDVVQSTNTSLDVQSHVAASNQQIDSIRQRVAEKINRKKEILKDEKQTSIGDAPDCSAAAWTLDGDVVGLLNAARAGSAAGAAAGDIGEVEAAAPVGQAEFIDNDLQVVKLYRELAERHDALVDYVMSILNKQAE